VAAAGTASDAVTCFADGCWRASLLRLLCAIGLVVGYSVRSDAISPDDPATTYYETCVAASRQRSIPDDVCDTAIIDALIGITVGEVDQKRPSFCYPQNLIDQMQSADRRRREHPGQLSDEAAADAMSKLVQQMRAAVAQYMREHPEQLAESTLKVIIMALLHAFPCPG